MSKQHTLILIASLSLAACYSDKTLIPFNNENPDNVSEMIKNVTPGKVCLLQLRNGNLVKMKVTRVEQGKVVWGYDHYQQLSTGKKAIRSVLWAEIQAFEASAGFKGRYNLKHVKVKLLSGKELEGKLISAGGDSLILIDKNKYIVGSWVTVKYSPANVQVSGKVLALTDSNLVIETEEARYWQTLLLKKIVFVKVKSRSSTLTPENFRHTCLRVPAIKSIRIRKNGSGGAGFFFGGLAAVGIVHSSSSSSASLESRIATGTNEFFAFFFGGGICAAFATSGKEYKIDGDRRKFTQFVAKIKEESQSLRKHDE